MSFLSKAWKSIRGVAAPIIGGAIGGPFGAAIGAGLGGSIKSIGALPSAMGPPPGGWGGSMSLTPLPGAGMASLGRIATTTLNRQAITGIASTAGRAVGASARSAMTYCRRHPVWCSTLGLAGVQALVDSGQLPPVKRRRSRGITGRELNNFRRVSGILNKWCKVPAPTQRARRKC